LSARQGNRASDFIEGSAFPAALYLCRSIGQWLPKPVRFQTPASRQSTAQADLSQPPVGWHPAW
jgi:hypothetical protein